MSKRFEFKTLEKAHEEIARLRSDLSVARILLAVKNAQPQKKSRGRPRGNSIVKKTSDQRKRGRPQEYSPEFRKWILDEVEEMKRVMPLPNKKKNITDKLLVEAIVKKRNVPLKDKTKETRRLRSFLKDCRDQTGIRQKKRKTPSKNT